MTTNELEMINEDVKILEESIAILRDSFATETMAYRALVNQLNNAKFLRKAIEANHGLADQN